MIRDLDLDDYAALVELLTDRDRAAAAAVHHGD